MTSPVETVAYPIQRIEERDSVIVPTAVVNDLIKPSAIILETAVDRCDWCATG